MSSDFDNRLSTFRRRLNNGSLMPPEAFDFFEHCLEFEGMLGGGMDGLGCREILNSFVSHLHLGSIRTPPECILSKRHLSAESAAHRPWIKLLDNDFDHDFYTDPESEVKKYLGQITTPSKTIRSGKDSDQSLDYADRNAIVHAVLAEFEQYDFNRLVRKWPAIRAQLGQAGVESMLLQMIDDEIYRDTDLPPIVSVNRGLKMVDVPFKITTRMRRETVFRSSLSDKLIEWDYIDTELALLDETGTTHSVHDVGSGVRVIVPVIVALRTAEVEFLSIEEPECHDHPKLQAELGDLLIERSNWTYYNAPRDGFHYQLRFDTKFRERSCLFVETHSEHLILRILRRIRETTEGEMDDWPEVLRNACPNGIRPEDVAALYVEPGEGGALIKEVRINHHGEFIDEWPNGFFEERIREVF